MVLNQQITGCDHTCSRKTRRPLIHPPVLSSAEQQGRETPSNLALRLSGSNGPANSSRHSNVKAATQRKLLPLMVTSAISLRKWGQPIGCSGWSPASSLCGCEFVFQQGINGQFNFLGNMLVHFLRVIKWHAVYYLSERFWQALQCKLVVAEFTVAAVWGGEPVLQAGPVHHGQAARALAGGQQLPRPTALMADPTEQLLTAHNTQQSCQSACELTSTKHLVSLGFIIGYKWG